MSTPIQANTVLTFGVVLFQTGTVTEMTGIASSSVTMYVWAAGDGSVTNVPNSGAGSFTWTEVDSTHMPGLYQVSLPATYTNHPSGEFVIYTYATGSNDAKRDFVIGGGSDVWDELYSNHRNSGSMGQIMSIIYNAFKNVR